MPTRPPRHDGSHHVRPAAENQPVAHVTIHSSRLSAHARGYTRAWRRAREAFLAHHPLCVHCLAKDPPLITAATDVDHIVPHRGDPVLFWNHDNWQSLCHECHSIKTAKEDGGFGNRKRNDASAPNPGECS